MIYKNVGCVDFVVFVKNYGVIELVVFKKIVIVDEILVFGMGKINYGCVQVMVNEVMVELLVIKVELELVK